MKVAAAILDGLNVREAGRPLVVAEDQDVDPVGFLLLHIHNGGEVVAQFLHQALFCVAGPRQVREPGDVAPTDVVDGYAGHGRGKVLAGVGL